MFGSVKAVFTRTSRVDSVKWTGLRVDYIKKSWQSPGLDVCHKWNYRWPSFLRVDEADGWRYPHVHRTLCLHIIGGNYSSQIKEKNFFLNQPQSKATKKAYKSVIYRHSILTTNNQSPTMSLFMYKGAKLPFHRFVYLCVFFSCFCEHRP